MSEGPAQLADSFRLWGVGTFDLMQVHNLRAWRAHLRTLRAAKADGRIRHIGITTSHGRRHGEMLDVLAREPLDFVQFTYNPLDRGAEGRLLPLSMDKGIAVIVNRPFQRGALIRRSEGAPLPGFAAELGCESWAQLILKFVVSHPGVACAIPATTNPDHMSENMAAALGPMPDAALRQRISDALAAL